MDGGLPIADCMADFGLGANHGIVNPFVNQSTIINKSTIPQSTIKIRSPQSAIRNHYCTTQ
jgi:hypothetical protein